MICQPLICWLFDAASNYGNKLFVINQVNVIRLNCFHLTDNVIATSTVDVILPFENTTIHLFMFHAMFISIPKSIFAIFYKTENCTFKFRKTKNEVNVGKYYLNDGTMIVYNTDLFCVSVPG